MQDATLLYNACSSERHDLLRSKLDPDHASHAYRRQHEKSRYNEQAEMLNDTQSYQHFMIEIFLDNTALIVTDTPVAIIDRHLILDAERHVRLPTCYDGDLSRQHRTDSRGYSDENN